MTGIADSIDARSVTSRRAALAAETDLAARRIERWLLDGAVQIDQGAHRGGVAGWLNGDGRPEFVYFEIAGYYLTSMAWLASGAASSPDRANAARARGQRTLDWTARALRDGSVPPTRLHLVPGCSDWRNRGVFTFDLAMGARGIAASPNAAPSHRDLLAARLCARIERISGGAAVLRSHEAAAGETADLPDRWSTRPGPHHVKAAAALLQLPGSVVGPALRRVCLRTCAYWAATMLDGWPCQELHTILYGLEGLLIVAGTGDELELVERLFVRLMDHQAADGTLPETTAGGRVRSDVLAQALRVGVLLRGRGHLRSDHWSERLDVLAAALLGFVRADGGVLFAHDQDVRNTWCAMFAQQALLLHAREGDPLPSATFALLV